jgi:uncharacterized protein DUF1707
VGNGRRGKDLRIGDPERERAMRLLGEHFSAGRLDVNEYDERCQQVAAARFGAELEAQFEDLPAPRPSNPPAPAAAGTRSGPRAGQLVLAVCAVALAVFLIVVARQLGLVLLVPLVALIWFTWRR